jgi:hypothetical protein
MLKEVLRDHPSHLRTNLEIAVTWSKAGDEQAALSCLDKAELIDGANFWSYYIRSKMFRERGDLVSAAGALSRGAAMCLPRAVGADADWILKCLAETRSLLAVPDRAGLKAALAAPLRQGRPLANCLHVSLIKDEEDIIHSGLEASYRTGFRYFAIGDNGSTDNTRQEVERFAKGHPDCMVYVVSDPVVGYYQAAKTMGLARLATTILEGMGTGIDWIFPLDADEVLHPTRPDWDLHGILSAPDSCEKTLLVYPWCNASATELHVELSPDQDLQAAFPVVSTFQSQLDCAS